MNANFLKTNIFRNFCGASRPKKLRKNCLFSVNWRLPGVASAKKTGDWRLSRHGFLAKGAAILFFFLLACSVQAAELYHTNRTFTAVEYDLQGTPPADILNAESKKLTNIVKGAAIKLDTTNTHATEKQVAMPICYESAVEAWGAAMSYSGTSSNYYGKIFDNVGWVRGTKSTTGGWGAYLWVLQNQIAFQSSTSYWWRVATNGFPVAITNVMVGSLGVYGPMSNVVDIGPVIPTNYPGADQSDSGTYQVDITNVFYEVMIPAIWITPRNAVACVGGEAVQFTVMGTNIPQGVTWMLYSTNFEGHAVLETNADWHYASVMPESVATNYKIRATSVNNTNLYDEVNLTIFKVDIEEPVQVTRAQSGTITAVITPSLTPDKVEWIFTGGKGGTKTTTPALSTSVILVDGSNTYTVTCRITKGSAVAEDTANITVNPRTGASWQITPACATDNEPSWGNFPGFEDTEEAYAGLCRNRTLHDGNIVTPVDGGFTSAQVNDPDGPNDGYWYIESTTLVIDMETVINKYMKSGTMPPSPPGTNWHEYNESQSVDTDGCLNGVKGHEYKGVGGSGQGHFAFLETKETELGMDARTAIEKKWHASSQTVLETDAENKKDQINNDIYSAYSVQPSGNWGPNTVYCYDFAVSNWVATTYGN